MPRVLVSNNSELLRHLASSPLRGLSLDLTVVASGAEAMTAFDATDPALALLDAEMAAVSGYDVARHIKTTNAACKVVLILGKRITAAQMQHVAQSGCDEILIAPMSADELYDVVAIQLGLARRGSERFTVTAAQVTAAGPVPLEARVTNLSVDGARLEVSEGALAEGDVLAMTITPEAPDGEGAPRGGIIEVRARVVWSQPHEGRSLLGASFEALSDAVRDRLMKLTQWEIIEDTERTRIVIKGDITEATNFNALAPLIVGRVDFDLAQVKYINSLGVRAWCELLRGARAQGYEFHACSIPFVLQASVIYDIVGRGTIASFFAPYGCQECDHQEERLLQSAAILATESRQPPRFSCPVCSGDMELDDIPDRYLAFLDPKPRASHG